MTDDVKQETTMKQRFGAIWCWVRGYHGTRQSFIYVPFCDCCGICIEDAEEVSNG